MLVSLEIHWSILPSPERSEDAMPAVPTLSVLPQIAKSCPHLRTLSLSALSLMWNESSMNLSHTVFNYLSIRKLFPVPSVPAVDVASFLDRLFPQLDTDRYFSRDHDKDVWRTILNQVKMLQTVRNLMSS